MAVFRRLMLFFCLFAGLLAVLLLSAGAEPAEARFYVGDTLVATRTAEGDGTLRLPDAPETGSSQFLGWIREGAEGESLHAAGETLTGVQSGTLRFRALTLELCTLKGAACSLEAPWSLRFDISVPQSELAQLLSLVGERNVELGILTAQYSKMKGTGANFDPVQGASFVTCTVARVTSPSMTVGSLSCFSARVDGIEASALLEKYAARGYLTLRYATGETRTVLAPFDRNAHARSAHAVLASAYEDVTAAADERYLAALTAAGQSYWSPYSGEERECIRAALDRVISVYTPTADGESVCVESAYSLNGINFKQYELYTSPYEVRSVKEGDKYREILVVGLSGADFRQIATYYIGHSYSAVNLAEEASRMTAEGFLIREKTETLTH